MYLNNKHFNPYSGDQKYLFIPLFTVFIFLLHTIPSLLGQDPPDITPTDFPGGTPFALGTVIIAPFNAADPGSTQLGNVQLVKLKVMTSLTGQPSYQWKKEGPNIPNATSDSYMIPEVGDEDAGAYAVDVTFNNITNVSALAEFDVVSLLEIEDVFNSWTARFFTFDQLENPELSSGEADPDFDSLNNLAEYFFGLNPNKTNLSQSIDIAGSSASNLSFQYQRSQERQDVILRFEGSNTLFNWFSLTSNGISVIPIDSFSEIVEIDLNWPLSPSIHVFSEWLSNRSIPKFV